MCRLAYEMMQPRHPDASAKFRSLDDVYYYGGSGPAHFQVAVLPHNATRPEEIELLVGDRIFIAGNHWDGFSKVSLINQPLRCRSPRMRIS